MVVAVLLHAETCLPVSEQHQVRLSARYKHLLTHVELAPIHQQGRRYLALDHFWLLLVELALPADAHEALILGDLCGCSGHFCVIFSIY